jgi:predicted protein tyrosine phosphatase
MERKWGLEIGAMLLKNLDYIQVIRDIEKISKDGQLKKMGIEHVLFVYGIPTIDSLEKNVLGFIFSINDIEKRSSYLDVLAEANNIPIIRECRMIISCNMEMDKYKKSFGQKKYTNSLTKRYDLCLMIIKQSTYFQNQKHTLEVCKKKPEDYSGIKYVRHCPRNKAAMRCY